MTATELKRDVRVLQRSIIDLLEQITALIKQAGTVLGGDKGDGRYQQFQQEIANEALKVKNLELRMAIVAPMKAGKSTIVNSIIGQDILPSRASAMTTLPTEIVFEAERSEPVLVLSPELLRIFQETLHNLKQKIQDLDPKALKAKIATHPHLEDLLQEVQNAVGLPMHESVTGREEIVKTLTGLNDIIRICSLIAPVADPLQLLTDVPRIHTPFWKSDTTGQSENLGNLVIVDTPGPNEAGENLRLVHEVKKQLQKSSIVLIVLDFNGLNTKAAEEIKHDVQQVIQVRGKKNLYVLVNKVDQRREGDPMTPERVRQFVSADLGLGEIGDGDRVFEISARRAFSASNFMQELEQSPDASIQDLRTARPLAQEVFGIDWEEELEDATLDELQRKAERLWKKSGFAPFLDKAIGALMTEAAPRCIIDALTIADDRLKQLRNQVVLRSEALNADEEKLRLEVGALENSLQSLNACRQKLRQVDVITGQLHQELNALLENLKAEARVDLELFFDEEEFQRAGLPKKVQMAWEKFFSFLREKEHKRSGKIQFESRAEAEEFTNQAVAYPKQRIDRLLEQIRLQVEKRIAQTQSDFAALLEKEAQPILERANERLKRSFNINLTLPNPHLQPSVKFVKPRIEHKTELIDQGYEESVIMERHIWHWLWIIPYERKIKVKRPDKKEDRYEVALDEIVTQINQLIEQSVEQMKQGVSNYLGDKLRTQIDDFFSRLNHHFASYQENLQQAQRDKELSVEQQSSLVEEIRILSISIAECSEKMATYFEYANSLVINE